MHDVSYSLQVEVVDPMSLSEEFINILSTSVVAVRVNAKIVLHSTLYAILVEYNIMRGIYFHYWEDIHLHV